MIPWCFFSTRETKGYVKDAQLTGNGDRRWDVCLSRFDVVLSSMRRLDPECLPDGVIDCVRWS